LPKVPASLAPHPQSADWYPIASAGGAINQVSLGAGGADKITSPGIDFAKGQTVQKDSKFVWAIPNTYLDSDKTMDAGGKAKPWKDGIQFFTSDQIAAIDADLSVTISKPAQNQAADKVTVTKTKKEIEA
jgi:hypothetical protein